MGRLRDGWWHLRGAATTHSEASPGLALGPGSTEQVALARDDQLAGAALAREVEAADDRGRDLRELAHRELGGAGDLVGDGDHRRVELVAGRVATALQVEQRAEAGHPDRDVGRAHPPRAAERGAHDHADIAAHA